MRAPFLNQSSAQENLVLWSWSRMQKAKQKETKLIKDLKKIQREKKTKQCAMVVFNPRFLQCSKCQQPQNYLRLFTTTGFSSGLRERKKKVKIQGFSLLSIIFARFLGVSENNPAMEFYYCAYCRLCLSECIFSWVESQVLRAGSKKKK